MLIQLLEVYGDSKEQESPECFLSVIDRDNDEKIVSKILAYLFAKDCTLAKGLVKYYFVAQGKEWIAQDIEVESIECEKVITAKKRIDIFVTLISGDGKRYCILIENKVRSHENGGQTKNYESWLRKYYPDSEKIYIYLKPSWNQSMPISKRFEVLTFAQLSNMIDVTDNYIVLDFQRYVAMKEMNKQLSESETILLSHYEDLERLKDSLDYKLIEFKKSVRSIIEETLCLLSSVKDGRSENGRGTFQFYDESWYNDGNPYYYFYIEYKFLTGDLSQIVFQKIIRKYKTDIVADFLHDNGIQYIDYIGDKWFILEREKFVCDEPIFSQAWIRSFTEQATSTLKRYKDEMIELVNNFKSWLETHN